jgi:hypothetical protein
MLSGRWTAFDPDFGTCEVVGSNRLWIALFAAIAVLVLLVDLAVAAIAIGTHDRNATWPNFAAGLAVDAVGWLFLAYLSQIRLVIGERGFRYIRPLLYFNASVAASWGNVVSIELVDPRDLMRPHRQEKVLVSLRDWEVGSDPAISIGTYGSFSVSGWEIASLMNTRLEASRSDPAGLPIPLLGSPSHGPRSRRGRRPTGHDREV